MYQPSIDSHYESQYNRYMSAIDDAERSEEEFETAVENRAEFLIQPKNIGELTGELYSDHGWAKVQSAAFDFLLAQCAMNVDGAGKSLGILLREFASELAAHEFESNQQVVGEWQ